MGLCKCPKKRVTNLFCFVHKVNVCEECMIAQHPRCVVQSYVQWLQDSDYDAVCVLCTQTLSEGELVRLCCLDLLHVNCLRDYVQSNSGSALTVKCPRCKENLFPPANAISFIADSVRQTLKGYSWARVGLGIEEQVALQEEEIDTTVFEDGVYEGHDLQLTSTPMLGHTHSVSNRLPSNDGTRINSELLYDNHNKRGGQDHHAYTININEDDDKYKKKHPIKAARTWFRSQQREGWLEDDTYKMKRYFVIVVLACLAAVTLIILLTRVGRRSAEMNPNLNWKFNPNVKTG